MPEPIDGIVYWFDWTDRVWHALWRPDLDVEDTTPPPGTGYGSGTYGGGPYGG